MSLSFILAMAWKSAVISGAALLLVALLRKRAAADRAALLRVGVLLLLLLPFVSLLLPALTIETAPAPAAGSVAMPAMSAAELAALAASMPQEPGSSWLEADRLAALAYLAGVLLIALRLGAGLLMLRRWTRRGRQVASAQWTRALERQAPKGRALPLLIASDQVVSPLSWGLGRPVILLDRESLERPQDADAILAHEMAHVARRDWLSLVLARAAVALFWFNPLVWLLERQVLQSAEEAADSHALEQVEAVRYAEALVTCAKRCGKARVPANSMAGSGRSFARRVKAVLDGRGAPSGSSWTVAAMVGCIGLAAPVAALQLVPAPPPAPKAPVAPPAPVSPVARLAALAPVAPPAPSAPPPAIAPEAPAPLLAAAQAASAVRPPAVPTPPAPPPRDEEEVDEEAIERAADAAERAAERVAERVERNAERIAERIAERTARDAERIAAHAERAAARAMKSARAAHSAGAEAMFQGANSMEAGARQMDEAARNLGHKEYREREIARAAAQGRRVTHEELIAAIPQMRKGAVEMRQGAKEMRSGAAEMRRQGM